ncbi:MAG TPA: aldehyde dehydrogenase family protein, partial [Actinocrinis sp.]|nr:aldehyde dehydrogenase family protein [Actinocrinis sp.]
MNPAVHEAAAYETAGHEIAVHEAAAHEVVNPATEQVIAKVPACGTHDVDAAVDRARRAFPAWRDLA